jgi:predicted XRE-type DNA-binding protein
MTKKIFKTGSGNVFVDLGFTEDEAAKLTMKSCLFDSLRAAIKKELKTHTQDEVAEKMGADQPIISKILNDKIAGFSIERIATYLTRLHYDICLTTKPAPPDQKTGRVMGPKRQTA